MTQVIRYKCDNCGALSEDPEESVDWITIQHPAEGEALVAIKATSRSTPHKMNEVLKKRFDFCGHTCAREYLISLYNSG